MKQIIINLVKSYYEIDDVIRMMVIQRSKGGHTIFVYPELAANKWNIWKYETTQVPDIERTKQINEERRLRIARSSYKLAKIALKNRGKLDMFSTYFGKAFVNEDDHVEMMGYCVEAFDWLGLIPFEDYEVSAPQIDEGGRLLGMKLKPKEKSKENDEILKEVETYTGKFEDEE